MPGLETNVWMALRPHCAQLEMLTGYPIAWPNESFDPPSTGYLRIDYIPNTDARLGVNSNSSSRHLSLLQISAFLPKDERFEIATEVADTIKAHFPADTRLAFTSGGQSVRVTKKPDVAQGLPTDQFFMVPVTVRLETFA